MDGVLIDSEPQHILTDQQTLAHFGAEVSLVELGGFTGMDNTLFFLRMREIFGLRVDVEELIRHKNRLLVNELQRSITAFEGLDEIRRDLPGLVHLRGLASSSFREIVDTVLCGLGMRDWFSASVAGDEVVTAKPDPAIFLKTATLLGVSPEECLVIEDSENGIESAQAAGMRTIGFKSPGAMHQDLSKANETVTSLLESLELIRRYCRPAA